MQILSSYGFEFEKSEGLNWIAGEVHKIDKKILSCHILVGIIF